MAATAVRERTAPQTFMQGIAVPAEAVNPGLFFDLTRRHIQIEKQVPYVGQAQEVFVLRKSDILSSLSVVFTGRVVIANGTGTTRTTSRWPYDLIKAARFNANGVSNLINASGLKMKIRDVMKRADLSDRGVLQTVGGVARTQGTLARASESWGVGSNTTTLANGTYDVELEWTIPIAEDEHDLAGAIFLQSSTADLTLELSFENVLGGLFVTTGDAVAPALTGNIQVISTKFAIPVENGQMVVPDLSFFHSLIQNRYTALQNGEQEIPVVGQGAGKMLLRAYYQVYNGSPTAPLAMTSANFGKQMWRFATSETPDEFFDGNHMRKDQERRYNCDVGALWGVGCHDFVHENARRDAVDLGTTSELRLVTTIQNGVTLSNAGLEYVTETLFTA
jgi:hypothetical protein